MKVIQDLEVVKKTFLNKDHFTLELAASEKLPEILPGQFAEVRVDGSVHVFLRRPISIHDVDYNRNTISFLIKIAGHGTRELSRADKGSFINVIFPLGNGFDLKAEDNVLLVGGGCGSAPLLYLSRKLHELGIQQQILLGAGSKEDLMETDTFSSFGQVLLTTDNGTSGEKGFITQHSIWKKCDHVSRIYCCGPEIMMKAVGRIAKERGIDCQVSLENTMACGIGACLCCVTETIRGNECVCTSGPVFNINELLWQI